MNSPTALLASPARALDRFRLFRAQVREDRVLLDELDQRTRSLAQQIEHISDLLETLDPQGTRDMVVAVRESVRELSIELTEQANRTSEVLEDIQQRGLPSAGPA